MTIIGLPRGREDSLTTHRGSIFVLVFMWYTNIEWIEGKTK